MTYPSTNTTIVDEEAGANVMSKFYFIEAYCMFNECSGLIMESFTSVEDAKTATKRLSKDWDLFDIHSIDATGIHFIATFLGTEDE